MENEKKYFIKSKDYSYAIDNLKIKKNFCVEIINKYIILLFLINVLLIFINIIKIYVFFSKNENEIKDIFNNNIGNYSLYNLFKYPQISILIPNIENFNSLNKNISIFSFINNLRNQTLKDIEILFLLSKKDIINSNIIKNYTKIDKRIKYFYRKSIGLLNDIYYLIENSKGKYIFIMNNLELLDFNEIEKFYNFTKGEINNIFKFKTNNENIIYFIKSKILRDINDKDLVFENITNLINYIISLPTPQLNYIPIALCPDNYYTPYAYVAMLSILNSKLFFSYISFYLIISEDFEKKNIDFLNTLYDQYDLFNITFLKMDNRYNIAYISRYLTKQTYYRFSLGELIPYLNKIIYVDTDIIVYNDLSDFFALNFNGKMILGQPTYFNKSPKTGIFKINNGILLFDLKKMRKFKLEQKVLYILNNGFENDYHDQFLLNQFFYEFIGIFPPKYHIRPWNNYTEIKQFNKESGDVYDNDYLYFSCKYPTIIHYVYNSKPIYFNISASEDWWYFARISKYFSNKTDNLTNIFNFTYD